MKPSDAEIRREWLHILHLYRGTGYQGRITPFRQRVALLLADKLEERGVTDADIDRLFGPTPRRRGRQ